MKLDDKLNLFLNEYDRVDEKKGDGEAYEKFFRGMLKKYKVKSPSELSKSDKKKFFKEIEDGWKKEAK